MLHRIAVIDCETTGLVAGTDRLIEVACCIYSVTHATPIESWSTLVCATENPAAAINRIPAAVLPDGMFTSDAISRLRGMTEHADAFLAHRAEFDRGFLAAVGFHPSEPWICSKFDIDWPLSKSGDSCVGVALAHGVPVTEAHRALTDVQLLVRTLMRCKELGHDVSAMLEKALRPRALYQALVSYDDRAKAKDAGFAWKPETKTWERRMLPEDAAKLPFEVRELTGRPSDSVVAA